jgi:hypothetical protein
MRLLTRALVLLMALSASARADRNDLTLERLIGPPSVPGAFNDPAGNVATLSSFRSLMSELGVVMAPRFLSPSDTLGWSGFHFSFDSSFTSISNHADFWRKGVKDVSSSFLPTITVMARKGLWAPVPSFELGVGGSYLIDSSIFSLVAYAKFGIHEGFHGKPVPSIALRAAVSHLFGTEQADLTVVSTDLSVSKSFGLSGTVKLDPYLGANLLITIVRSGVIDTTPNVDAFQQSNPGGMPVDLNSNTTFPDPSAILRWRLFTGLRLVYSIVAISAEFAYTFCNDTALDCQAQNPTRVTDRSDGQAQLSLSAGFLF